MIDSLKEYDRIVPEGAELCAMQRLSYSDEAAHLVQQGEPSTEIVYADDIDGVWDAVEDGKYGMIPFENSSKGVVWKHFDRLRESNVRILGEVHLHVRMAMGGLMGAAPEEATHVHSHPVGLAQCDRRLKELGIPPENFIRERATPDGPRAVAALGDPRHICLGTRAAIEEAGLQILEDNAANHGSANITQFFVVHKNGHIALPEPEKDYHAAIVIPDYERIGVLHDTLGTVKEGGVDLNSLHSQRLRNGEAGYRFFLGMEGGGDDPELFMNMRDTLANCSAVREVQWLGSWNGKVLSDSIGMEEPTYRSPNARPEVSGDPLDVAKRYHAIQFMPDNYPGVLYDETGVIRRADVNLRYVHSRPEGHRQYSFLLGMDSDSTTPERLKLLMEHMQLDSHLQYVRWLRSTNSLEELHALEPEED